MYVKTKLKSLMEQADFIESATVPVIKLKIDLQKVQEQMRIKALKEMQEEGEAYQELP